jgi:hypothetical protein
MAKCADLTGQVFARLTVLERVANRGRRTCFRCRCICGQESIAMSENLKSGTTRSCGCLMRERTSQANRTHGQTESRLYRVFTNLKTRCTNPRRRDWKNYGGRGIAVCPEWLGHGGFEHFQRHVLSVVGPWPGPGFSIDRKNNDGNYEPGNLRWATATQQELNKRRKAA